MRTLFDTSVLVPALTDQLANQAAALDALHRYSDGDQTGAVRLMRCRIVALLDGLRGRHGERFASSARQRHSAKTGTRFYGDHPASETTCA